MEGSDPLMKYQRAALSAALSLSLLASGTGLASAGEVRAKTPIRHLVVIYQENVSFDHYFATYPTAANPSGEPVFRAAPGTPFVNNLQNSGLLYKNPNAGVANGSSAALPFRLDRTQAATADQNHSYTPEQQAYDNGAVDLFPLYTGAGLPGGVGAFGTQGQVMGYYDGNTVTALWHYAQRFAMSDASFSNTYGPSTPGALEVVSGQTNGLKILATTKQPSTLAKSSPFINDGQGGYTMINDIDPGADVCSSTSNQGLMTGRNIGDLLNERGVSWGGFMGGFNLKAKNADGSTGCQRQTYSSTVSESVADYIPHHNWFQYYASTANPTHARPSSIDAIGSSYVAGGNRPDPANHEYDLEDFYLAARHGIMPTVSFIKMPAYQDGHAGYSDPLDEQNGIVKLVNFIQQRPEWKNTAIIIAYDDSDGWYDHAFVKPTHSSFDGQADQLNGAGVCGSGKAPIGVSGKPVNGRCGPGTRLPMIVISPYARVNYVSHKLVEQSSVARFIEDNWLDGKRLGQGSFDASSGQIDDMFDFQHKPNFAPLFMNRTTGNIVPSL